MSCQLCCQELQNELGSDEGLSGWYDQEALLVKQAESQLVPCVLLGKRIGPVCCLPFQGQPYDYVIDRLLCRLRGKMNR